MFSKKMQDALNEQIKNEFYSAYLYLAMAAYCDSINLSGFAHWLRAQFGEEQEHAMKLYKYIGDRGGRVVLQAIDQPASEFQGPLDVFEKVLDHEKKVTAAINNLYELALQEKDYPSQTLLQWYVNEQVEEESTASTIIEQLKMIGDKGPSLIMMDRHLASRGRH